MNFSLLPWFISAHRNLHASSRHFPVRASPSILTGILSNTSPPAREKPSVLTVHFQPPYATLVSRKAEGETEETGEQAIMEERMGEAFASNAQLTVIGRRLHPGGIAPDFCLNYLDLVDMAVHTVRLSDFSRHGAPAQRGKQFGTTCLPGGDATVGSALCSLPSVACIYTVSMDLPQMQARSQDRTGVLHQALSAHHSVQFGQDFGVWIKEWHLLQRAVVVIDRDDRIVYVEYVPDQMSEPDYTAAMQAVQQAYIALDWKKI